MTMTVSKRIEMEVVELLAFYDVCDVIDITGMSKSMVMAIYDKYIED
jgi:hypothetical protein